LAEIVSTAKTQVAIERVEGFLRDTFSGPVSALAPLKGGEASEAFGFREGGEAYVIRVNTNAESFEKDRYAFTHFGSDEIPVPEVISIGSFDDTLDFAISRRAWGRHLVGLTADEHDMAFTHLMEVMDAFRRVDVRAQRGYGEWDAAGRAIDLCVTYD
jgi:hygromycin-B 4-O-kinase